MSWLLKVFPVGKELNLFFFYAMMAVIWLVVQERIPGRRGTDIKLLYA